MSPPSYWVLLLLSVSGLSRADEIARFKPVTATREDLANHSQVTVSALTRGSGISSVSGAAGVWASRNWASGSSPGEDDYIEFVVTVDHGAIDFAAAWYTLGRSSGGGIQGPQEWQLQYSLDGFASAGILIATHGLGGDPLRIEVNELDLSALPEVQEGQSITFRLFGYMADSGGFAGVANDQAVRFTGSYRDLQPLVLFAPVDSDDPLQDKASNPHVQVSKLERGRDLVHLTNPLDSWISTGWSEFDSANPDRAVEMTIATSDFMIDFDRASFTYIRSWSGSNKSLRGPETWIFDSILVGTKIQLHKITLSTGVTELAVRDLDLSTMPTIHPGESCQFRWTGMSSGGGGWGGFKGGGKGGGNPILITGSARKPLVLFDPTSTTSGLEAEHSDPDLLTSPLTRGPGISASSGLADAWASASWGGGGRSANDYFETTLTALAPIQLDCMSFTLARSTGFNTFDGPTRMGLEYILNGMPAVELYFVETSFAADVASFPVGKLDLSQVPRLGYGDTITFRWFGYLGGASGLYGLSGARKLAFYGQAGIPLKIESIAVDNGQVRLQVRSEPGAHLRIDGSSDGESWGQDSTFTSNRIIEERTLQATDPVRLFRVVPIP